MARTAASVSVDRFFELSLLGLVASGFLAVSGSGYIDRPTAALTAVGLLLRGLLVAGAVRFSLSNRVLALLTLAYIGFYPIDYYYVSGEFLAATVHLVFFLAVMKVLTARATRDHIFVAVIAFLNLLAASVLSASASFFVYLALFLFFGVATFASAEIRRSMRRERKLARWGQRSFHWRLAALTASAALAILLLTAGLFFLLPRTAQAAFQRLAPQRYHIPGFSNEVTLGEIGQIQQRRTAVMHVRFFNPSHPDNLKWRGVALAQFDGRRWYNRLDLGDMLRVEGGMLTLGSSARSGFQYEVQLGLLGSDVLFFAGQPRMLRIDAPLVIRTTTDSYRLGAGTTEGLHYGAYCVLDPDPTPNQTLPPNRIRQYLELPPNTDSRIAPLSRRVAGEYPAELLQARALENYLRREYRYTLDLPEVEAPDPLAYFLFQRRQGHCEYFASAMAVMLRTLGIPSRVVNGFQSGVYNPVSGWYIVRASDAHSWVEAWIPGHGWRTFDPTPPDLRPKPYSIWTQAGMYLDAADTFWQEWVLNYNLDRQLTLASRMEDSGRSFSTQWVDRIRRAVSATVSSAVAWVARYGVFVLTALLLMLLGSRYGARLRAWWRTRERVKQAQRGAARASDATLLYARMLGLLKRRGFEKPPWLTPAEFARVLPASEIAGLVREFTSAYNDLRFGSRREAAPRMVALLDRLERG
jgi:transglutaminase-like putative cysteine protease